MADFPPPQSTVTDVTPRAAPITPTLVSYALFGVAGVAGLISAGVHALPLLGTLGIIGVIIAYVKRDDARGTFVESHLRWLIRTFWYSILWGFIGGLVLLVLGWILIGIPIALLIWAVASIWVVYRVVRGYLLFKDNRPIPGM